MQLKRILLISGRYLLENLYRELRLKNLFEKQGIEVVFALPSRNLNANGYTKEIGKDNLFNNSSAVWLETEQDYKNYLRGCDAVLFGSWKSYLSLAEFAHMEGKPAVNFNSTSGLDHWPHGVDYACVKGSFSKKQMLYYQEKLPGHGNLKEDEIIITGSIIHEHYHKAPTISHNRDAFCEYYRLDPTLPIVVLFPKGIGSYQKKINMWFPKWSERKRNAYNQWVLNKYADICYAVKEARCNLIVKMHPSAYTAYLTKTDEEFAYWEKFPWARVLMSEHTYACYEYSVCGLGISTHSALDMGYFNKPFVFIDSDQIEPPTAAIFDIGHLCSLPLGPSSHWSENARETVNPWFPSWLGYFSRVKDLPALLSENVHTPISSRDRQRFIQEFWYKDDGRAGERVVDFVINYIRNFGYRKKIYTSLNFRTKKALKDITLFKEQTNKRLKRKISNIVKLRT